MRNSSKKRPLLRSIEVPKGLRDLAISSLKEAILSGDLKPGVMFSEMEIAEQLGISRTPIREALLDLSSKGFITFIPRRGFQIREITEDSARELYVFRMILETAIIRIATPLIDTEAIRYLKGLHREDKKAAELKDMHGFINVNRKFHEFLAELTSNNFIIDSFRNVRELIELASLNIEGRYQRMVAAVQEHKAIMDRLRAHDTEGAVAMMERHIRVTEDLVLRKGSARKDTVKKLQS
jgi:GntR family transcriptional regulator, rspAB operon transcriptional repressor